MTWEVSTWPSFWRLAARGHVVATAARDYTAKVGISGQLCRAAVHALPGPGAARTHAWMEAGASSGRAGRRGGGATRPPCRLAGWLCVQAEARGLYPGTTYYFRFRAGGAV